MSGPGMGFTGPQIGSISGIPNQNFRLGQMLQGQGQPLMGPLGAPGVMPMIQQPNTQFPLNPGSRPFGLGGGFTPPPGWTPTPPAWAGTPSAPAMPQGPQNPGMMTNGPIQRGAAQHIAGIK